MSIWIAAHIKFLLMLKRTTQQNCQTEFPDICADLIETPGVFTRESMKNGDSLEANNQFNTVWVRTVY